MELGVEQVNFPSFLCISSRTVLVNWITAMWSALNGWWLSLGLVISQCLATVHVPADSGVTQLCRQTAERRFWMTFWSHCIQNEHMRHCCLSLPLLADTPQLQANTCHVSNVLLSVDMCFPLKQKVALCITNIQRLGLRLFLRAQGGLQISVFLIEDMIL